MIKDNYLSIAPRNILIVLILMYVIPKYLKQLISRDCKRDNQRVQPTCRFGNKTQNSIDEVSQIIQQLTI